MSRFRFSSSLSEGKGINGRIENGEHETFRKNNET